MKKVVLAYSGGLDTTYCALYLNKVLGYEVHAITVDTGGFEADETERIAARAASLGVASYRCVDVTRAYYDSCLRYLVYANALKNGTYPLSVSAERMIQAITVADFAVAIGADAVAHGSTGAGNDQVRFDMVFHNRLPEAEIITPIRDKRLSREEELEFLRGHGIYLSAQKAAYSINKGLWGTSVGGRETLQSNGNLPEEAWPTPLTKQQPEALSLGFERGELRRVNDRLFEHPVDAIRYLQALAQPFAIGRDIHVGDTIIGIKGRVGFEAAAPLIIIKAHQLLEKHTLTKWQIYWKDQLSQWYANWLHEGQLLDPVMRNMETFFTDTQQHVTGTVHLTLHPFRFVLNGIESPHDLMSDRFGSYGEMNNTWTGEDVKGFSRIFGNQNRIFHTIHTAVHHD